MTTCALSIVAHHAQAAREAGGARPFVQYTVDVRILQSGGGSGGEDDAPGEATHVGSWRVARRFSQFVELHHELSSRYAAELHRCGAELPSKFRLPSSLAIEGAERAPALDEYLRKLLTSTSIRKSEQLMYFVAASTSQRRRVWDAAVPTPQPVFEISL